jgi:hypothetical protein
MQIEQQKLQMQQMIAQHEQEMQYRMKQEDNQTKILVAEINARAESERMAIINHEDGLTKVQQLELEQDKLAETKRQFDAKLALDKQKEKDDVRIKEKQIAKASTKKS